MSLLIYAQRELLEDNIKMGEYQMDEEKGERNESILILYFISVIYYRNKL